jgi:hypothetical protein
LGGEVKELAIDIGYVTPVAIEKGVWVAGIAVILKEMNSR